MKISIVTPVYNCEDYIEKCILSIKNQTYHDFEHIIVDGGSTDNTLKIIKKYEGTYNMKYVSEKDNGMYDAICKGFKMATGDIFAWLNADDMYQKNALEIMNKVVSKGLAKWCTGYPVIYDERDAIINFQNHRQISYRFLMKRGYYGFGGCSIQQESTFWTRELWEKAKGEDIRQYKLAGDFILWKKFAQYEDIRFLDVIISGFRKHSGQKSEDRSAYRAEIGKEKIFCKIIRLLKIPQMLAVFGYKAKKKSIDYFSLIAE